VKQQEIDTLFLVKVFINALFTHLFTSFIQRFKENTSENPQHKVRRIRRKIHVHWTSRESKKKCPCTWFSENENLMMKFDYYDWNFNLTFSSRTSRPIHPTRSVLHSVERAKATQKSRLMRWLGVWSWQWNHMRRPSTQSWDSDRSGQAEQYDQDRRERVMTLSEVEGLMRKVHDR